MFLIEWTAYCGLIGLFVWLATMDVLCTLNFKKNGVRRDRDKRRLSDHPDLLSQQIEYQNKATYQALEFYLKVLLAVLGAVGFVVLKNPLSVSACLLVDAAGWIIVLVSCLFAAMIFVHQKSKIERWLFGYRWWSPLFWNETWFFVVIVMILASTRRFVWLLLSQCAH